MAKQDSSKNSKIAPVISVVAKGGSHLKRYGISFLKFLPFQAVLGKLSPKIRRIAMVLVAAACIAGGVWGWQVAHEYKVPPPNTKFTSKSLLDQVNQLEKEGRYADAQKLLASQAVKNNYAKSVAANGATEPSAVSERSVMVLQANAYENENNYAAALQVEQQIAQKYGLDSGLAITIAQIEMQLHNNQAAKDYYNKALALLQAVPQIAPVKAQINDIQITLQSLK